MLTPGERRSNESLAGFKRALAELGTEVATKVGAAANAKAARELRDVVKEHAPQNPEGATWKYWRLKNGESQKRLYGQLRDNIRVRRQRARKQHHIVHHVTTGRAFWGMFLEFGTVNLQAQPWFRPIVEVVGGRILDLQARELGQGIERAARRAARHTRKFGPVLPNGRNA